MVSFEGSFALQRTSAPVFRDSSTIYKADACSPLIEAARASQIKLAALARGHYPGQRLKHGALPGLATIGHWDAPRQQQWGLPWHRNEGIEISYLESGAIDFGVDDREFVLQPGSITVTRPWQLHRLGNPHLGPNKLHWLILDVGIRRHNQPWRWPQWFILSSRESNELKRNLLRNEQVVWRATKEVRHCFQLIAQAVERDADCSNASRLAVRINDLFLSMLDQFRSQPVSFDESKRRSSRTVRLFLARLATDPHTLAACWTLERMAAECGLKVTQFVHYVRELTNAPPLHYLNHCRLEYAAKLLRDDRGMSITDVALACGFSSSQYFATLFRVCFGIVPTAFRESVTLIVRTSAARPKTERVAREL